MVARGLKLKINQWSEERNLMSPSRMKRLMPDLILILILIPYRVGQEIADMKFSVLISSEKKDLTVKS